MDERAVRVVLVEDNPADARLMRERLLEPAAPAFEILEARRLADAVRLVATSHVDVVLLDLSLPDAQGLETVRRMQEAAGEVPIVVLTHRDDEALAAEALRSGIQDYVVKGQYPGALLVRAVSYAIERKRAERHLAVQYGITRVLADAPSLDTAVPLILQTVCRVLEWDWGAFWASTHDNGAMTCAASWAAGDGMASFDAITRARIDREHGLPERVREGGDPVWISDVTDSTFPRAAAAREVGLHAAFAFPVSGATGFLGVMEFFSRNVRLPDKAILSMMGGVGSQVGQFIERKHLEQERAALLERAYRARREAEEASRLKDEFLLVLSHELRTPLNVVMGRIQMLKQLDLTPAERDAAIVALERNAAMQLRVVDDLLDISRIITGRLKVERQKVVLSEIVRAAVDAVRPGAEAKDIDLSVDLPDRAPEVSGDPVRLTQILWNLLSNAIKFTPRGGQVTVRLGVSDGEVEVRVTDTGAGISPAFLPHLFERFKQADASPTRAYGGLGLGLAISKQLVEAHGGRIEAQSEGPGQGASFAVYLPRAPGAAVG